MHKRRKYIIWAFVILSAAFIGFYMITKLFSRQNENDVVADENFIFTMADTTKQHKDGKILFQSKCASCHILFKDFVGPDLIGLTKRGPWGDRKNILEYLKNPQKFIEKNDYMKALKKRYLVNSQIFLLSEKEIDDFVYYIESEEKDRKRSPNN